MYSQGRGVYHAPAGDGCIDIPDRVDIISTDKLAIGGYREVIDLKAVHDQARARLEGICRVCVVCDGRSCPSGVPGMGGRGMRTGFRRNRQALDRVLLNLRTMHRAVPSTGYELFGIKLAMPVLGAPMCETTYNFLGRVDDYAFIAAQVNGAAEAGILAFTGDSPDPPLYEMGLKLIRSRAGGRGIPIIKPREPDEIIRRIRLAEKYAVLAVGIDIDAAGFDNLNQSGQPVGPLSVAKLRRIIDSTSLPVILKGIMTADEALQAVNCGAAGLVVSNHGGRALDQTPGTAEVLPEIVSAVKGSIRIFLDGGIRSGEDVLKILALGAEAALIGRPVAIAAIGSEEDGVSAFYQQVREDMERAMLLTGCSSLSDIGPDVIRAAGW